MKSITANAILKRNLSSFSAVAESSTMSSMCSGNGPGVVPTGLDSFLIPTFPTLKRGANKHCASGACVRAFRRLVGNMRFYRAGFQAGHSHLLFREPECPVPVTVPGARSSCCSKAVRRILGCARSAGQQAAPEAQCLLGPRFSVGYQVVVIEPESRRDGAR